MRLTPESFLPVTDQVATTDPAADCAIAPARAFLLPMALTERLAALCAQTGDAPHDVVLDALALHLDEFEGQADV